MKHFLFFILIAIPNFSFSQINHSDLKFNNGKWYLNEKVYTGTSIITRTDLKEYYQFWEGVQTGYFALYNNYDTAAVHTYNGEIIHLVFYTKSKKKTLVYNQKIIGEQTYTFGEWIDYRDDGIILIKGNYIIVENKNTSDSRSLPWKSVRDGKWYHYDETGNLIKTETWRKDKLIRTK